MVWGRRPIFTPQRAPTPTPTPLPHPSPSPKPPPPSSPTRSLNVSARWAPFHPGGITSLFCFFVVTHLVIKAVSCFPPEGREGMLAGFFIVSHIQPCDHKCGKRAACRPLWKLASRWRAAFQRRKKKPKSVAAPGDFIPWRRMVSLALECKTLNLAS